MAPFVGVTEASLGGGGGCAAILKVPEVIGSATPFVPEKGDDITVPPPFVGGFNVQTMFELYGHPLNGGVMVNVLLSAPHVPLTLSTFVGWISKFPIKPDWFRNGLNGKAVFMS